MAQRDKLMAKWGPLLTESIVMIMFSEINILRTAAGLPERTKEQFFDEINNHLSELVPYDWMYPQA